VSLGHFLVDDAAARRHPLDVARRDDPAVAEAVPVLYIPVEYIGDGLDAPVRVPGKSAPVVVGVVGAEGVQQEEGIELGDLGEAERALEVDAGPLNGRFALPDLVDRTVDLSARHDDPPCASHASITISCPAGGHHRPCRPRLLGPTRVARSLPATPSRAPVAILEPCRPAGGIAPARAF